VESDRKLTRFRAPRAREKNVWLLWTSTRHCVHNYAMCNRYRPASVTYIRDVFGFTLIEDSYPSATLPLWRGPFIVPGRALVGQWGLTPDRSKTLKPTRSDGRPLSTNNCRRETVATAWSYRGPWSRGQRCLIPALDYDEPYYPPVPDSKNIWWRLGRADGQPWALAGIWNEWRDPETGEITFSYSMLTQNCDAHPLLKHFHKPEKDKETGKILPPELQDKRTVVPIEPERWAQWLHGSIDEAAALIQLPAHELFSHGAADPTKHIEIGV
jgi:putative SOS response-associated peptidase YedK